MNNEIGVGLGPDRMELLLQKLGNRVRNLSVRIIDGQLILEGNSTSYHAKQLAQHEATEQTGLSVLANNIVVCRT